MVYEILNELAERNPRIINFYRSDMYELICSMFRHCHKILLLLCDDNEDNKVEISMHGETLLKNFYVNFGQIELLKSLVLKATNFSKRTAKYGDGKADYQIMLLTDPALDYLFKVMRYHGQIPDIIDLFIDMVRDIRQNSVLLKKKILDRILDVDVLGSYKIGLLVGEHDQREISYEQSMIVENQDIDKTVDATLGVSKYSFKYIANVRVFEVKLVILLSSCLEKKISNFYTTLAFELYPFNHMILNINNTIKIIIEKRANENVPLSLLMSEYLEGMVTLMEIYATTMEKGFIEYLKDHLPSIEKTLEMILSLIEVVSSDVAKDPLLSRHLRENRPIFSSRIVHQDLHSTPRT